MLVETTSQPPAAAASCPRLGLDDRFPFRCAPDLPCFNQCCRDVTIVLTPYDILRLKRALRIGSSEFLEAHTLTPCFPQQKFPLVILKMDEAKQCPLLSGQGCSVYRDRPWACRMYPLGSAEPKRPSPENQPFHFLLQEGLCKGHEDSNTQTVREWLAAQRIDEYEAMGAAFKSLTLDDFWEGDKALTPEQADMFYMACYDVDRFRRFVFETRFLELFDIDEARVEAMRGDDEELLELGMQWLRFCLFNQKTMRIKRSRAAAEALK